MLACIQVKLMTYLYYEDENNSEFTLAIKILTSPLTERWVKSNFLKKEKNLNWKRPSQVHNNLIDVLIILL